MKGVTRVVERIRLIRPWAADLVLALGVFTIGALEVLFFPENLVAAPFVVDVWWSIALFGVMSLALSLRRKRLWLTYLLVQTAAVVAGQTHQGVSFGLGALLVFNVLLYTIAEQTNGFIATAAVLGQLAYVYSLEFEVAPNDRTFVNDALWFLPFFGFAAFAGWAQRRRRRLTKDLEARVAEVRAERERLADMAVTGERDRIAGELRALVVQGVDEMTRSADGARERIESDPARARAEIEAIETTGRQTLVEMRRLLGVLRRPARGGQDGLRVQAQPGAVPPALIGEPLRGPSGRRMIDSMRAWRGSPWLVDVLVVLAIGSLMLTDFARAQPADPTMGGILPRILGSLIVLSLLFRRRIPFTVLTVVACSEFLWILTRGNSPGSADRALWVAVYSVAAYKDTPWAVAAVGMAMFAWSPLPVRSLCFCQIDIGALSTFAAIAGHSMLLGRRINRQLEEQTDLLRRTREERVRAAVADERARVAREMHDVVAHGVTGMVVQAGGARMVMAEDPLLAEAALDEVRRMGHYARRELRVLIDTLDGAPGAPETQDPPGDLHTLVDRERRAGQVVALEEEGQPDPDLGLQMSTYRIVQEALTNVRKHAPGASVDIAVQYGADAIEIQVVNGRPATGPARAVPGAGQGLVGIRERAAVFGGMAETGPTPQGGFRVVARLPRELVRA